ncbi:MAG: NAD(P)/FAD-dependent oxidoreductase [Flavobacteriaceae bacterium]|nr:NAD(P)/FAD-dependent oxidoreductase [Flavobacteriaceae bacterium]
MKNSKNQFIDVIIIGAGISGIGAACHMRRNCPNKSFLILEGRANLGGTWDLFKYPGVRSDSDMYTFAYKFKPWTNKDTISDGKNILKYLNETTLEFDLEKKIKYNHWINEINWSSTKNEWKVSGFDNHNKKPIHFQCKFLMSCTGYYDYSNGYTPNFNGLKNYKGNFIHPQKWNDDVDYSNKNVVVIGSGATAITLIPSLSKKANHVTMLQRSPTYLMNLPKKDKFLNFLFRLIPSKFAHFISRWKYIIRQIYFYKISKLRPKEVKSFIKKEIKQFLPKNFDIETHFNPKYNPWDERICVVVDNDLFNSISEEKCTVVTDQIKCFKENSILLESGKELKADLVISATGLNLKFMGGIKIKIDNKTIDTSKLVSYKGMMLQNIPNATIVFGYTNASWTLKIDLVCEYFCRIINYMDKHKLNSFVTEINDKNVETEPSIELNSGYVKRASKILPKQGKKYPWKLNQNYIKDMISLKFKKIEDGYINFK